MCWRKIPSKAVGSAARAARERALRASVLNSTRWQSIRSKACLSISSLASMLTPVSHAEGVSQVHPISRPWCSGRRVRKRVLPMGVAVDRYQGTLQIRSIIDGDRIYAEWSSEYECPPQDAEYWSRWWAESLPTWLSSLRDHLDAPPSTTCVR